MDRAQELRTLMKQSAKGDSNGGQTLSGKDKAKLLKLMREQQKQKDATPAAKKAVQNTKSIVPDNQTSGLPAGFFDATPVSNLSSVSAQLSAPAPQSAIKPAANSNVSNLPQGFFDNPVEDLSARGITMEQFTAKMEKEEQAELDSFLTEVKGLEGDRERAEEEIEQQEGAVREFEEEAAQMTYLAHLIALRAQSEHLLQSSVEGKSSGSSSSNSNSHNSSEVDAAAQEALQQLLKEAEAVQQASTAEPTVANDVDAILYQKLAQEMASKRKRSAIISKILNPSLSASSSEAAKGTIAESLGESDSNNSSDSSSDEDSSSDSESASAPATKRAKYTPLDFMDWTARSV